MHSVLSCGKELLASGHLPLCVISEMARQQPEENTVLMEPSAHRIQILEEKNVPTCFL